MINDVCYCGNHGDDVENTHDGDDVVGDVWRYVRTDEHLATEHNC